MEREREIARESRRNRMREWEREGVGESGRERAGEVEQKRTRAAEVDKRESE